MEPQPPIIATTAIGSGIAFSREERERHVYIVGKSGSGKSTVLIQSRHARHHAGKGSPSSIRTATLPRRLSTPCRPSEHTRCATSMSPTRSTRSASTRSLACRRSAMRLPPPASSAAFKHLWRDSWGPRLEHFLYHGVAALLESPRPTLIDLPRIYTDEEFRARVVARVSDPMIARFWTGEYASYDRRFQAEAAAPFSTRSASSPPRRRCAIFSGRVAKIRPCARDGPPRHLHRKPGQGADRGAGVNFSARSYSRICNSSPWRVATRRPRSGRRSSSTSTSFNPSAPTHSRRCFRKRASSRRIFRSQTNTPNSSTLRSAPRCSATPAPSWSFGCRQRRELLAPNSIRCRHRASRPIAAQSVATAWRRRPTRRSSSRHTCSALGTAGPL